MNEPVGIIEPAGNHAADLAEGFDGAEARLLSDVLTPEGEKEIYL